MKYKDNDTNKETDREEKERNVSKEDEKIFKLICKIGKKKKIYNK